MEWQILWTYALRHPQVRSSTLTGTASTNSHCAGPASGGTWKNHGEYVSSVAQLSELLLEQGLITQADQDAIVGNAAESKCGSKAK